jgi:hypothetical protein
VVDAAWTAVRLAHHQAGRPEHFDHLGWLECCLPAAIEAERQRKLDMRPLPIFDANGGRKAGEAARRDVPRELTAPLILGD